jgi:glycosyltransferase involved in cell wall biosynthesis
MVKVALVSNTDWYLYNFRLSLARHLQSLGWEVTLISPAGAYAAKLQQAGFTWLPWSVTRQSLLPWQELTAVRELARLYRQLQLDLVHHHTIKPVLYGGMAARLAGVPAIVNSITGRGYVFEGQDGRARTLGLAVKPFYRWVLRNNRTRTIFENDGDRQYFTKNQLVQAERTHLIESVGVDATYFQPLPEPEGPVTVLLAARLLWDKGVGVLVDAARLLKEHGLEVRIVLAGEPDPGNPTSIPEAQLLAWQQAGLVEWWGWQADMRAVYARCHIVALPSFHEGVPAGLLEAAACARPIVASDIPGCRTVVIDGETGLLVPVEQPGPLAQALERLLSDPDLRGRMGQAGRRRILQNFTQPHINQQTVEVYRLALAQAGH